jgi:hypothetical protein
MRSGAVLFLASYAMGALFFFLRYIPHEVATPGFTWGIALAKLEAIGRWGSIIPTNPRWFYSWEQFQGYGPLFVAVCVVSLGWVAVRTASAKRTFADGLVFALLGLLTAIGYFSFKYPRGMYLLAPLYLSAIALAFSGPPLKVRGPPGPRDQAAWQRRVVRAAGGIALLVGLAWPWAEYRSVAETAESRQEAVLATKLNSRAWLSERIAPGARIGVFTDSEWGNPPLEGLGYDVRYRFLDFPYLDSARMMGFHPPTLEHVEASVDVIVLNDYHMAKYLDLFSKLGRQDLRMEWEDFFNKIRGCYPIKRFEAVTPAYGVRVVEVIVVHERKE